MGSPYRDREPAPDEPIADFRGPCTPRMLVRPLAALLGLCSFPFLLPWWDGVLISLGILAFSISGLWVYEWLGRVLAARKARQIAAALAALDLDDEPRARVALDQARARVETEMPPCEPTIAPSAMHAHQ
jgi:hypothetical protein